MEFWGIEVKCGETFKYSLEDDMILHLSQACLGEIKEKANEPVYLYLNIQGKKLVLGTLITEKLPQQQFDLVFDKDIELSHNLKSGSVYFCGYVASNPREDELTENDSDDSDEDIPLLVPNGPPLPKAKEEKPVEAAKSSAAKGKESAAGKQKVKIVQPKKDDEDDEDSSDEDVMSEGDEDDSEGEGDSDDSDDSSESDEETPKKAEPSKKRPAESASKTPIQDKKAKVPPQKTDGKKVSGHVATPHPAKQAGKTPATKPNQKTPKSGDHACKSCDRSFATDKALESHSKAKHSAAK